MSEQAEEIIKANREVLGQGIALLGMLSDEQYTRVCEPWLTSTIGQHIRHVVDMYLALINSVESDGENIVNYDYRQRGSRLEHHVSNGREALQQVVTWLDELKPVSAVQLSSLQIQSEISLHQSTVAILESSLLRELVFVGSHSVHHYALIRVIARHQGLTLAENFGVAPATASFIRGKVECAQ